MDDNFPGRGAENSMKFVDANIGHTYYLEAYTNQNVCLIVGRNSKVIET